MTDAPLPTPDLLRGECVHGCEDVRARECDDCIRLALRQVRRDTFTEAAMITDAWIQDGRPKLLSPEIVLRIRARELEGDA